LGTKAAEAANQINTLEVQKQALTETESQLRQSIQKLPILTREYANLQRELEIATGSLTGFLETRQKLQIEAAQREIPWQLIQESAQSPTAITNDVNRSLMMGMLISLMLGFAAALLLEKVDTTYHSAEEVKEKTKLPVLGVIPFNLELAEDSEDEMVLPRKGSQRSFRQTNRWLMFSIARLTGPLNLPALFTDTSDNAAEFMEAFRVLQTNIQMLERTHKIRSLVISSAVPGDGKTTIALHWAKTAAAMGQRVLLVDTDLRYPQIHQMLELKNEYGLSDFIVKNVRSTALIQQVPLYGELYVLTAGQFPVDPASLLASPKIKKLNEEANQLFDLVIYDAPPILKRADANLLAQHADGLVLVVRLDKTDRYALKQVLDNLKGFQIPILGAVINGEQSFDANSSSLTN
jgi:capsular exopolysaccharide synthesis family protein